MLKPKYIVSIGCCVFEKAKCVHLCSINNFVLAFSRFVICLVVGLPEENISHVRVARSPQFFRRHRHGGFGGGGGPGYYGGGGGGGPGFGGPSFGGSQSQATAQSQSFNIGGKHGDILVLDTIFVLTNRNFIN